MLDQVDDRLPLLAAGIALFVLYTLLCAVAGVEGRLTFEAGLANVAILLVAVGLRRTVTREQGIYESAGFLPMLILTGIRRVQVGLTPAQQQQAMGVRMPRTNP